MGSSGTYPCTNPSCGKMLEDAESATLWFDTEFGLSTKRACRNQECARAAVDEMRITRGWKLRKGNLPPMPAEEREAFLAKRAAAES